MNIVEAYIKQNGQFILLILGLPCSNKSRVAKEFASDLNFALIKINNYLKADSYVETVVDDVKFKLYEHSDNYNWDKLNEDVESVKEKGAVIYGNYIDTTKINFSIDFCYFLDMKQELCKKLLIEKKLLPYAEDDDKVKIYFEKIFNSFYKDTLIKNIQINKFLNLAEQTNYDKLYDDLYDTLMEQIKGKIYK